MNLWLNPYDLVSNFTCQDICTQIKMLSPSSKRNTAEMDIPVQNILKSIPSTVISPEKLEEERRLSMEMKARKSEVSRQYNERIASIATVGPSRIPEPYKEPVIEGKASVHLCSDLEIDQLCCQYNEDFTLFAAGGADGIVRLYETTNYSLLDSLSGGKDTQGFTSCVTCIKHKSVVKGESNDHHFIISYVNGIVKCFDYTTNQCKFTINEGRQTYGLTFHPRMQKFITYGDDMKIYLYDYETQIKEGTFKGSSKFQNHDGHTSRVFAAMFNPASNAEFLSGGWDTTVLLWDLRQPHACRSLFGVNLCAEGLDIDKAGTKILTCSWRKTDQLQLWDYSTFKLISTLMPDAYDSKLYCGRFLGPEFIAVGGGDPSVFRVIDKFTQMSRVVVTNISGDVCHLNVGKTKCETDYVASKVKKKKSTSTEETQIKTDLTKAPEVIFAAGGAIYHVDYYN